MTQPVEAFRKPRLLVLTSTYPRWAGDPEPGFVHELARRLVGDFEIEVIGPHAVGALAEEVLDGVRVRRYRYAPAALETLVNDGGILTNLRRSAWKWLLVPGFLVAQRFAITRALRRFKPDVIHAHWLLPQGLLASSIVHEPVVITSHGADLFGLPGKGFAQLRAWVVRRAETVTVVSAAMREHLLREVPDARVEVMPMGVDVETLFYPDEDDPVASRRISNQLLFVGRLVEKKGLPHLIEALPEVIAKIPDTTLKLVGFGPLEQPLRQRVAELSLTERVEFTGALPQSELAALYRRATLFVAPFVQAKGGDQEGLGLVVAEAMACGCPVLVGDVPGVRDLVTDRTGVRADAQDRAALSAAIVDLLGDREKRARLAEAGRAHVCQRFGWNAVAHGYAVLLKRVANGNRE